MRKIKLIKIAILALIVILISFNNVYAHSVELDPESLISFPYIAYNGEGTITISSSETGYSLYWQAIEISDDAYTQIETIRETGQATLDDMKEELDAMRNECNNLEELYNEAHKAWQNAGEEQKQTAKEASDAAYQNWQNKVKEYNEKVTVYNAKVEEITTNMNNLIPMYIEENWTETLDGKFKVDISQFSGDKAYVMWAKLITSSEETYYDEAIYTFSGSKIDNVEVTSITLDKSEVTIKKGSSYTLTATITPNNATNKLIKWSSSNNNVATVSNGKVTAISEGTATITATTVDGNHTATCKVTVTGENSANKDIDNTTSLKGLPYTGTIAYITIGAIFIIGVVGIIMYKKYKHLNFK